MTTPMPEPDPDEVDGPDDDENTAFLKRVAKEEGLTEEADV